jgi:Uma2 family endonuclease
MSRSGLPHDAVVYPCSDGQPMAETQIHGACMMYVTYALKRWFGKGGRADVHVGMNSFLYYEQGNPRAVVTPDVYVVPGAPEFHRDTYLLWNEPKGPDFVLEVTSASTRRADERRKRDVYAALGVREYFLYDPRAEWLTPPLQGFRLHEEAYRAVPAVTVLSNRGVAVASEVLGLELRDDRDARMVRLRDLETGEDLPTYEEAERAREEEASARQQESEARQQEAEARQREAEGRRREAEARQREAAARRAAEARVMELEARLRALGDG